MLNRGLGVQALNQVVIWDKIVTSKEKARLIMNDEFNKYALVDQFAELRGAHVELKLNWDVMPIVGMLELQQKHGQAFTLPDRYV